MLLASNIPSTSRKNNRPNVAGRASWKAQSSMELLTFFSIALLVFSIAYTVVLEKAQSAYDTKSRMEAAAISGLISSEINTAVAEGDGYSKNITLPDNIFGAGYVISVDAGNVFVTWRGKNAASRTISENVSGNFIFGNNKISNKGGVIFVN